MSEGPKDMVDPQFQAFFVHVSQGASSRSTSSSIAAVDELPRPLKQPSGRFMNPWKKNGSLFQRRLGNYQDFNELGKQQELLDLLEKIPSSSCSLHW